MTPTARCDAVADALREALPADCVLEDVPARLLDDPTGVHPGSALVALRPRSTADVASVVRVARALGVPLVARGGGTGLVGGAVAVAGEVVLDLSALTSLEVDPVERTVTAGAGVTLGAVQEAAAAHGLWLPVDIGSWQTATVGGVVATNAGGTRVLRHGHVREQLLGVEAVLGTGEVVSRLHAGRKDNNGYSLAALLCGSEGTLGIVTRATLRLAVRQDASAVLAVQLADHEAVLTTALVARDLPHVQAVELVGSAVLSAVRALGSVRSPFATGHLVLVELGPDGDALAAAALLSAAALDVVVATDRVEREQLWALRHGVAEAARRTGPVHKLDLQLPLRQVPPFLTALEARVPDGQALVFGHVLDGNVHVNLVRVVDEALLDAVVDLAFAHGGHASAEHGIGVAKNRWLSRTRDAAELAAMKRLRDALDPDRVLNPRVLVAAAPLPPAGP